MDKISVCITVFNEEKGIKRVLTYLEKQIGLFEDLIIVSDACVDKTDEIVNNWIKNLVNPKFTIKFFVRPERLGRANAIRLGIYHSLHDILIIFSGDIKPIGESFRNLINYFKDETIGAVTGHPILLNSLYSPADCLSRIMWSSHNNVGRIETEKNTFFHLNGEMFGIRKSALINFKGYDGLVEDAMLGWLIYKNGFKVVWSEKVVYYMKYPSSMMDWLKIRKRCCFGRVELAKKGHIKHYPFYELNHIEYLVNILNVSKKHFRLMFVLPLGIFLELCCRLYYHFIYDKKKHVFSKQEMLSNLWIPSYETKW